MVYIVTKNIHNKDYLYIHRSIFNKGKRSTEYVAYLGAKGKITQEHIDKVLKSYSKRRRAI